MFTEERLLGMTDDLMKNATVMGVENMGKSYMTGSDFLTNEFIISTIATLVGFVVYHLLVVDVIKPSTGNSKLDTGLIDGFKLLSILFVSQTLVSGLKGEINYSDSWIQSTLVSSASFVAFHTFVADKLPQVEGRQALVMDISKVALSMIAVQYMSGGDVMDIDYLISLAVTLSGFVLYHEVVHPRVFA